MRALVIGADGFVGRWLVRHLVASGDDVAAGVGPRFKSSAWPFDTSARPLDVRDGGAVNAVVQAALPEVIYDLAGVSAQGVRDDIESAIGISVVGSLNVLAAASSLQHAPRLLFVSTSYVYRPSSEPIGEDGEIGPSGVYAAAKLAAERALLTLAPTVGVDVLVARPFNHFGPGQDLSFVVPQLAAQIASVPKGAEAVVRVHDASVVRDFTDVRDVVTAYRIIAADGRAGSLYNVASGHGKSIADVAQTLATAAGVTVAVRSEASGSHGLPLVGNPSRVRALGWRGSYDGATSARDLLASLTAPLHEGGPRRVAS